MPLQISRYVTCHEMLLNLNILYNILTANAFICFSCVIVYDVIYNSLIFACIFIHLLSTHTFVVSMPTINGNVVNRHTYLLVSFQ